MLEPYYRPFGGFVKSLYRGRLATGSFCHLSPFRADLSFSLRSQHAFSMLRVCNHSYLLPSSPASGHSCPLFRHSIGTTFTSKADTG